MGPGDHRGAQGSQWGLPTTKALGGLNWVCATRKAMEQIVSPRTIKATGFHNGGWGLQDAQDHNGGPATTMGPRDDDGT